jgi:broad specificity phosphatase PhoE
MKIGVARHFPVPHNHYDWLNKKGFGQWIKWYDLEAEVQVLTRPDITQQWDVCYCSDLKRTKITAHTLYKDTIQTQPLLREVPYAVFPFPVPMPLVIWKVLARIGWWANMKFQVEVETHAESLTRAKSIISSLVEKHPEENILIVSHGFFMQYLNKELHKIGFKGKIPIHPQGGDVYTFER